MKYLQSIGCKHLSTLINLGLTLNTFLVFNLENSSKVCVNFVGVSQIRGKKYCEIISYSVISENL